MNLLRLSWKNLTFKPLSMLLSITLFALGVGLISLLFLLQHQLQDKFEKNLAGVDLVIGAKGSPLQLILSSMYHVDAPTGNVELGAVKPFLNPKHPLIERAIPLSMGDSYRTFRIVGTTNDILDMYQAELAEGKAWERNFEVTIGSKVARDAGLRMGDSFSSSHGFLEDDNLGHDHTDFKVVGILKTSGTVLDQLILTTNQSYWLTHEHGTAPAPASPQEEEADEHDHEGHDHGDEDDHEGHDHEGHDHGDEHDHEGHDHEGHDHDDEHDHEGHDHEGHDHGDEHDHEGHDHEGHDHEGHDHGDEHDHEGHDHDDEHDHEGHDHEGHDHGEEHQGAIPKPLMEEPAEKQITAVLVQFKGRNYQALNMQRSINENTEMQAATPAIEINRLYSLMDSGEQALRILAIVIIIVSALSIFISLLSSLRERKYELALMRVMGSSHSRLFLLILFEGLILALLGWALGFLVSHGSMQIFAQQLAEAYGYDFSGWIFLPQEWLVLFGSLALGILAAILPAMKAGQTDISETLLKE
ncbi:MAG: FtsX-like permease family protein [Bacteroidota bacterium]